MSRRASIGTGSAGGVGSATNGGETVDTDDDGDGVPDAADDCGKVAGGAQNGCPLPTRQDQCKKEGYKNYGTSFRNQGACVSYVVRR